MVIGFDCITFIKKKRQRAVFKLQMIHSEKLNYIEPYNVFSREVLKMWLSHSVIVYCKFYKTLSNHTLNLKLHSASELTSAINKLFACCI